MLWKLLRELLRRVSRFSGENEVESDLGANESRERAHVTTLGARADGVPRRHTTADHAAPGSRLLGYLGLFSSMGTLVCCALPSLFVLFGLGATVVSVLGIAPWLVSLSRHKNWVFAASAVLIASNFYYVYRLAPRLLARRGMCDPDDPENCARVSRATRVILWLSVLVLSIGFSVAYLLPVALVRLEG